MPPGKNMKLRWCGFWQPGHLVKGSVVISFFVGRGCLLGNSDCTSPLSRIIRITSSLCVPNCRRKCLPENIPMYVCMCLCMYSISFIMFLSLLVLSCERHPHAVWIGCAVKARQSPRTKTFVRSSPPCPMNENVTAIEGCDQRAELCQLLNGQVSGVYRLLVTFVAVFSAQGDLSIGSTGPIEKCGSVRYHALSHSGHS